MKNIKYQFALVLVFLIQLVQAQPGFEDDVEDVPEYPINDWTIPAIVLITVLMFFYFRNRQKQQLK
jgi:hypothetical protein